MRTIESLENEEARLRKLHSDFWTAREWEKMDAVRQRIIRVLDQIHELKTKPNLDREVTHPIPREVTKRG